MIARGKIVETAKLEETIPLLGNRSCPLKPVHVGVDDEESTTSSTSSRERLGYVLLLLSALGFTTMGLLVRMATGYHGLPVSTVIFLRGVIQTLSALLIIFFFMDYKEAFTVSRRLRALVLLRGFLGAAAMYLTFFALSLLPLGIHASLFFLNPIFTLILSSLVLGEAFGSLEVAAALLSFSGVVLVSNPTLQLNFVQNHSPNYVLGCFTALLSALFAAFAYITLRSFGTRVNFMVSVLSLGFFVGLYGFLMGGSSTQTMREHPYAVRLVLIGCVFGFAGTCFLNKGFQYCRAGTGALMRNIDVPIAYFLGVVFLGEVPHVMSLVGSALVVTGTVLVGAKKLFQK